MSDLSKILCNVYQSEMFQTFRPDHKASGSKIEPVEAYLLLMLSEVGVIEGFRLGFYGSKLSLDIPCRMLLEEIVFSENILRLEVEASDVVLQKNSFTTKWHDITALVFLGQIIPKKEIENDLTLATEEFFYHWHKRKQERPQSGLSLRWGLLTNENSKIELVLQCLPDNSYFLRNNQQTVTITAPTITLMTWSVNITKEKEKLLQDLQLYLFAPEPRIVRDYLSRNPADLVTGKTLKWYICKFSVKGIV
jgi:hypothetical protein